MLQITALAVAVAHNEWGPLGRDHDVLPHATGFTMFVWPGVVNAYERRVHTWDAAKANHTVGVPA